MATPVPTPQDLSKYLYWYRAQLRPTHHSPTGVVDGDSMQITIDMGIYEYRYKEMRVANINSPELSTAAGKVAKQWAIDWFASKVGGGNFIIHTHLDPSDKYGRVLAMVYAPPVQAGQPWQCYNDDIVAAGHAVPFEVESYG